MRGLVGQWVVARVWIIGVIIGITLMNNSSIDNNLWTTIIAVYSVGALKLVLFIRTSPSSVPALASRSGQTVVISN